MRSPGSVHSAAAHGDGHVGMMILVVLKGQIVDVFRGSMVPPTGMRPFVGGEREVTRFSIGSARDVSYGVEEARAEVGTLVQVGGPAVVVTAIVVATLAALGTLSDDLAVGLETVFQAVTDSDTTLLFDEVHKAVPTRPDRIDRQADLGDFAGGAALNVLWSIRRVGRR